MFQIIGFARICLNLKIYIKKLSTANIHENNSLEEILEYIFLTCLTRVSQKYLITELH